MVGFKKALSAIPKHDRVKMTKDVQRSGNE
ncbi:hypothetical protein MPLA_770048 [Mesorhizobium sp. ORS 3359]|nr:hypothetical protein MPLA_770048 [Mesorhizobium sp. ORS 3359]